MRYATRLALLAISAAALAAAASPLEELLGRAGRQVSVLADQLAAVSCREAVDQLKLTPQGKKVAENREVYDYLVLMQNAGGRITVVETREAVGARAKESRKQTDKTLLVTGGFSVLALIFHPDYQSSYFFRELPGAPAGQVRIGFEPVPGAQSPSVITLKNRDYPISWKGEALLDERTGALRRIEASLASSMEAIGLMSLEAAVDYAPIAFSNPPASYLLPSAAVIEARTRLQRWRNRHEFSGYRRFSVETDIRIGQ
jgi:hypothetical protein